MPFKTNVFINCPFDEDYKPILKALVYSIIYIGLEPQISITTSGSTIRINKIKGLIRTSKYSIHDLSRSKGMKAGELPRFNMPYELGLDIGCIEYGNKTAKEKKILILETEKYHYQKVLSDIAGQDIQEHNDEPKKAVQKVRDWFATNLVNKQIEGADKIWNSYNLFLSELKIKLLDKGYTSKEIENMQLSEFIKFSKAELS